jgi:ketosteroid isomerase-like protein
MIPILVAALALSDEALIRDTRKASNAAIQRRDIKAFAASLGEDLVVTRSDGTLVPSRSAYVERFAGLFADPKAILFERIADKVAVSKALPLAAEMGHWVAFHPDGSRAYSGTYMAMWRKTTEGWKIRSELYVRLELVSIPRQSRGPY